MSLDRDEAPVDTGATRAGRAAGDPAAAIGFLLGDAYHPGGLDLARRLLDDLGCGPGQRLLDLAAGRGTTALLAAAEHGARVDGVDLDSGNVALATGAADARGLADLARFHQGDAKDLPFADATFDLAVCQCTLRAFPDTPAAGRETARVLRSGGRVGITGITADPHRLPAELASLTGRVARAAAVRPAGRYGGLLTAAGLVVTHVERHDRAVSRMVDQIDARLDLLRITSPGRLDDLGLDLTRCRTVLEAARRAVLDGSVGYVHVVAEKP
jgi:SAM-dependent methyltransferase